MLHCSLWRKDKVYGRPVWVTRVFKCAPRPDKTVTCMCLTNQAWAWSSWVVYTDKLFDDFALSLLLTSFYVFVEHQSVFPWSGLVLSCEKYVVLQSWLELCVIRLLILYRSWIVFKLIVYFPHRTGSYKYKHGTTGVLTKAVTPLNLEVVEESVQTMDTSWDDTTHHTLICLFPP